jgi:hypothetical protein
MLSTPSIEGASVTIVRALVVVVWVLLAGCQAVVVAAGRPTGETRNWKTYRVEVGEHVVQFSIPPGESREFPSFTIPARVDLTRVELFDEALSGPTLLNRVWDYRSSRFVPVDGSLSAGISVNRSERPLDDLAALRQAVEESSRLYAMKMYVEEGRRRPSNKPVRFDPVWIAGRDAWKVTYELIGPGYVVTLDQHHYLEIGVDYGGFMRQDWRADAKAAANAILNSIRIEPR